MRSRTFGRFRIFFPEIMNELVINYFQKNPESTESTGMDETYRGIKSPWVTGGCAGFTEHP